jgi:hypothetical protein
MDAERFDWLARRVGSDPTRRTILLAVGGLPSVVLTAVAGDVVAANKQKRKKRKRRRRKDGNPPTCSDDQRLCGRTCVRGVCCPGEACGSGNCICRLAVEGDAVCVRTGVLIECVPCPSAGCQRDARCAAAPSGCSAQATAVCQPLCAG